MALIGFVGAANELRERFEALPLAYVGLWDVAHLVLLFLPTLISLIVPVTYMLGILLAFGGLAQHGEIIAMRAAGIPLQRVALPVIVVGGLLSVFSFVLQEQVGPWATARAYDLIYREMPLRITFDTLPAGVMHEYGGWRVYIGRKDPATHTIYNLQILVPDREGRFAAYTAESARLVDDAGTTRIEIPSGYWTPPEEQGYLPQGRLTNFVLTVPETTPRDNPARRRLLYLNELFDEERRLVAALETARSETNRHELRKIREEISSRLSLPFACLAVSFVAAPLGVRARRGGRSYSFAMGSGIFVTYFLLKFLMESRSLNPLAEVIFRGQIPNIVLCLAGLWFLWRVDRA